jgi:creatinine amidohydrolase/Fe(II)-dependent formamide hydrolase-like protein
MARKNRLSRRGFLHTAGLTAAAGCSARAAKAAEPPSKKRRSHKYEELLPEEFYDELARAPIAYWGTGAMEEHGLHNPLGTDLCQAYEVCLRAAKISGGIVFPPVPFGCAGVPGYSRSELRSGKLRLVPPSLWTSRELCKQIYIELLESLAGLKFKACVAYGGHWPCDLLLQEIDKELGGRVGEMRFWGGGTCSILRDVMAAETKKNPASSGHGMMWETSLVMAMHPDWVDLPRAQRIQKYPLDSQLKGQPQKAIDCIATANAELGNRMLDTAAQRAANLAKGMLASSAKPGVPGKK